MSPHERMELNRLSGLVGDRGCFDQCARILCRRAARHRPCGQPSQRQASPPGRRLHARAGWVSTLLLKQLWSAVQPPGPRKHHPCRSQRSQAVGRRRECGCPARGWCSPRQPVPEPGGSACCDWNGYGTQRSHPDQRTHRNIAEVDERLDPDRPGGVG